MNHPHKNIIGKRFGKLTVVKMMDGRFGKRRDIAYLCVCDCGKSKQVLGGNIRSGKVSSCGCLLEIPPNKISNRKLALQKRLFSSFSHSKRNQSKGVSLSFKQFISIIEAPCYYCGRPPSNILEDNNRHGVISSTVLYYSGIDRVSNERGYSTDNSIACCKTCNFCKGALSQKDFLDAVKSISTHLWK